MCIVHIYNFCSSSFESMLIYGFPLTFGILYALYMVSLWYLNIWYSLYALYETLRVSRGVMFIAQYPMGPNSIYPKVYSESSSRPPLQLNCIHKAKNVHCITRQTQMSNRIWVKHVFGGGGWVVKEEEWRRPQRLHHQSFPGACPSRTRPWWNNLFERKTFLL